MQIHENDDFTMINHDFYPLIVMFSQLFRHTQPSHPHGHTVAPASPLSATFAVVAAKGSPELLA
jgi:hypothetical protein